MTLPDGDPRTVRGSSHGRAKITEADALALRRLRVLGWTYPELARRFGICRRNVHAILRGETWGHVTYTPGEVPALPPPAWPSPPIAAGPESAAPGEPAAPHDWTPPATEGPTVHPGRVNRGGKYTRRPRGERTNAKTVRAVRELHARGWTGKAIARQLGLSAGTVSEIVNGKVFKEVTAEPPGAATETERRPPLDEMEVKELRAGGWTVARLASRYGVRRGQIRAVLQGE
jgi:transcriptional regulator with XRE-family HTH domain